MSTSHDEEPPGEKEEAAKRRRKVRVLYREKGFRGVAAAFPALGRAVRLSQSEWPDAERALKGKTLRESKRQVWAYYAKSLREDEKEAWEEMKHDLGWYTEEIKQAETELEDVEEEALISRIHAAKWIFEYERGILRRFMRQYKLTGEVPILPGDDVNGERRSSEAPSSKEERGEWLKEIDREWQREQREKAEKTPPSIDPPWEQEGITKEAYRRREGVKAAQVGKRLKQQAEARWAEKSDAEKRRAIKLQLQHRRAREAFGSSLPNSGVNWLAPEWFGDFPIPWNIETVEGFDTDALIQRVEHRRERYAAFLRQPGGAEVLRKEKEEEIEKPLEQDRSQYDANEKQAEEIIYDRYPEPEQSQLRSLDMLGVNSVAGMGKRSEKKGEKELAEISRQQQTLLADMHTLRFGLWVLNNVLNRYRRGLPNTREAWDALYAEFEADPDELKRAYAAEGLFDTAEPPVGGGTEDGPEKLSKGQNRVLYLREHIEKGADPQSVADLCDLLKERKKEDGYPKIGTIRKSLASVVMPSGSSLYVPSSKQGRQDVDAETETIENIKQYELPKKPAN